MHVLLKGRWLGNGLSWGYRCVQDQHTLTCIYIVRVRARLYWVSVRICIESGIENYDVWQDTAFLLVEVFLCARL